MTWLFVHGFVQLAKGFDAKLGGFGGAPKFPRPVEVALMMRHYKRLEQQGKESASNKALEMALFSLRYMARGGMHDHIGGGFHRYSVDEYWHGMEISLLDIPLQQPYHILYMVVGSGHVTALEGWACRENSWCAMKICFVIVGAFTSMERMRTGILGGSRKWVYVFFLEKW